MNFLTPWGAGGGNLDNLLSSADCEPLEAVLRVCSICLEEGAAIFSKPGSPWPWAGGLSPRVQIEEEYLYLAYHGGTQQKIELRPIRVFGRAGV
jgi:hypothetical protein